MVAYGKIKKINSNYVDIHPPKGYINWWENTRFICKKRDRQLAKKEIEFEINCLTTDKI